MPIRLADGQAWHFRAPRMGFRALIGPDWEVATVTSSPDFPEDYHEVVARLEEPGTTTAYGDVLRLALPLLRANYGLAPEAAAGLFGVSFEDPDSIRMWADLLNLVLGRSVEPAAEATT